MEDTSKNKKSYDKKYKPIDVRELKSENIDYEKQFYKFHDNTGLSASDLGNLRVLVKLNLLTNKIYSSLKHFPKYERLILVKHIADHIIKARSLLNISCYEKDRRKTESKNAQNEIEYLYECILLALDNKYIGKKFGREILDELNIIKREIHQYRLSL